MGFNIEKRYNNRNIDYINMKNLKTKILIVDDDVDILEIISYNLNQEGYQVMTATNGVEAIAKAKSEKPHLILLDIMMPVMDGMEACEQIRKIPELKDILIAFLTARNEDYSQVAGFERGADDYITKPIKPKLLMSRIKGLLRRNIPQEETSSIQTIGSIQIDKEAYKIIKDHIEIILPRKEFELICLLASKPGKVFSREEILETIWGNDVVVGGRTIDVHIRKLREKLGNNNFVTIKGVGYKLIG
ncbi:response regulator transcription factor [Flavobacterium branchiophilum]